MSDEEIEKFFFGLIHTNESTGATRSYLASMLYSKRLKEGDDPYSFEFTDCLCKAHDIIQVMSDGGLIVPIRNMQWRTTLSKL